MTSITSLTTGVTTAPVINNQYGLELEIRALRSQVETLCCTVNTLATRLSVAEATMAKDSAELHKEIKEKLEYDPFVTEGIEDLM